MNEGVVQDKHDSGCVPRPRLPPKQHLSDITDVADFRMAETKLPEDERSVKNHCRNGNSNDNARNETQNGVRIRK